MMGDRKFRWVLALTTALALVATACGDDDDDDGGASDTTAAAASDTTAAGATTAGGAAGAATDPCDETKAPAELETVKLQLNWTPNTNHTGFYVADELGCYAEAGVKLEILPYSGGNADEIVASGQAEFGITFHNSLTLAGPAGVPVVAVAAILQKTAEAIAVKADRADIASPKDLDGKIYTRLRRSAGGARPEGHHPGRRRQGRVRGRDADHVGLRGRLQRHGRIHDPVRAVGGHRGHPRERAREVLRLRRLRAAEPVLGAARDLEGRPDGQGGPGEVVPGRQQKGWQYAAANPKEAGQLLIDANPGVFENTELVFQSAQAMADGDYLLDASGTWGAIDPAVFSAYSDFLVKAGIVADASGKVITTSPDWTQFIDTSVLPA